MTDLKWQGVISENEVATSGKSRRIVGMSDGKPNTFSMGLDKGAGPPVGQTVELTYTESSFVGKKDGKTITTKWIGNWKALQPTVADVQRHNGNGKGNTFPTVQEQFVKEVVAGWAHAGILGNDLQSVKQAIMVCKAAWDVCQSPPRDTRPPIPATGPTDEEAGNWADDPPPPATAF